MKCRAKKGLTETQLGVSESMSKLATMLLTCTLLLSVGAATAADDAVPDISEIMSKCNKGNASLMAKIKAEAGKGSPDWMSIQESTAEFAKLADALGKNKPPKGSAANWKTECDKYSKLVKSLDAAAQKKSKADCTKIVGNLQRTCAGCHKQHKAD